MDREIYLDNNATTRALPEVAAAMLEAAGVGFGNPSSVHSAGDRSRERLTHARECVAKLIGAEANDIVFTSGGTEANNLVLGSLLWRGDRTRLVTTTIEHSSIVKMAEYLADREVDVVWASVHHDGVVNLDELDAAITPETDLVSVQWVNNETGVVQPIADIAALCRERGVLFHTDAAQAVGKLELKVADLPIDFLTLTGHKFHAPPGVGALYARDSKWLRPYLFGGMQEGGLRAGTENLPGIAGLGKAAEVRYAGLPNIQRGLAALRDRFEQYLLGEVPTAHINGDRSSRVCNTSNIRFEGIDGEALVVRLDQEGIRCSQSSACTNRRPEPSYVLRAMGLSEEEAYGSVRFSFSELNTEAEVDAVVVKIAAISKQLAAFLMSETAISVKGAC